MKYLEVGGLRLSRVGLGTWQFGSGEWGYGSAYAQGTAPEIVERSLDLGVTLFDTAEIYGFGRSERILGEALGARRSEAVVATKLFPLLPFDPVVERRARGSARRLGTDVLDLYQVHWPNPLVPAPVTMAAMGRLVTSGLVRHVGVSNYSLARWQAADAALGAPVVSNQVHFNLLQRQPAADLVPWAAANDRVVIAYSPLAQGLFSGRYDADHRPSGMRGRSAAFLPENLERLAPLLAALRSVADAHGATTSQVALAWLLRRPNVVVIPGASSVGQAEANAAAADLDLGDDEDAELLAAAEAYQPVGGLDAATTLARRQAEDLGRRFRRAVDGLRS